MQSNPVVEKQQADERERHEREDFRYPFHICCVFMDSETNDFPIILETRDYCKKNHLTFKARQYDIDVFGEDMMIQRLPAFHIYYKKECYETHYYNNDPIHKIQLVVWAFEDRELEKERIRQERREKWNTFMSSVKHVFSLEHFKKKPALDLEASLRKT
jgi:hypothetical protein